MFRGVDLAGGDGGGPPPTEEEHARICAALREKIKKLSERRAEAVESAESVVLCYSTSCSLEKVDAFVSLKIAFLCNIILN